MKKIAIKNKIIKWLGGYTQDELIEKKTITFTRTEKQLIPIKVNFAAKTNDYPDYIRSNLCYQIAEYILDFNLCYYNMEYDPQIDCYMYKAVVYVREP